MKNIARYDKPVVVLSGPGIMSSAESFLLMIRVAGATFVGGRSRGSSGFPVAVELGHGISTAAAGTSSVREQVRLALRLGQRGSGE